MKKTIFALFLCSTVITQAALLNYNQGEKSLEGINLNKTATTQSGKSMDLLGAGLRSKKVLFVNAKVYVIQLFSDNKTSFSRDAQAIKSLVDGASNVALKISMLRTVDASSLAVSFKEALQANGFTIDSELTTLLSVIENGASGTQGKDLSLLLSASADASKVDFYYEDADGKLQHLSTSKAVMSKVLSIWLGVPADDGLKATKEQLLKPVY